MVEIQVERGASQYVANSSPESMIYPPSYSFHSNLDFLYLNSLDILKHASFVAASSARSVRNL
jgi:hypothetical protein